jgi:hypothetical protein
MKCKPVFIAVLATAFLLTALSGYTAPPATVEQVPRLTKDQVKDMLGNPDVVIVDIRFIKQWEQSDQKIPGALFAEPENFDAFVKIHPKEKTYIFY